MYIYRSDEMATKGSNSSKYQSTICSLLDLSSLAIPISVIVLTPYTSYRKAQPDGWPTWRSLSGLPATNKGLSGLARKPLNSSEITSGNYPQDQPLTIEFNRYPTDSRDDVNRQYVSHSKTTIRGGAEG
jgi:hypothetical protein